MPDREFEKERDLSYNTMLSEREDLWKHKSTGMRCHTCMFWVPKHGKLGRCRRHCPEVSNGWPVTFEDDWCGDHKLDKDISK